jgi:sarcosine oxidase subunit alpha
LRLRAPDALWRIRPQRIVIAAGAIERPLIVPDNDRPGVMSADAALVYLKRFGVLVGQRVVVATNNDSVYPVAEALAKTGAEVEIVDTRFDLASTLRVTHGAAVEGVVGTRSVEGVRIWARTHDCDALLLSGGWSPTVHLYAQACGRLRCDETRVALIPMGEVENLAVAGAAHGRLHTREGRCARGTRPAAARAPRQTRLRAIALSKPPGPRPTT